MLLLFLMVHAGVLGSCIKQGLCCHPDNPLAVVCGLPDTPALPAICSVHRLAYFYQHIMSCPGIRYRINVHGVDAEQLLDYTSARTKHSEARRASKQPGSMEG